MSFSLGGSIASEITRAGYWQTYTPILTVTTTPTGGTISYQDVVGKYLVVGKLVFVQLHFIVNSITGGQPAFISVSLPFSPSDSRETTSQDHVFGFLHGFENGWGFGAGTLTAYVAPISQDARNTGPPLAGYIQKLDGTSLGTQTLPKGLDMQGWYVKE